MEPLTETGGDFSSPNAPRGTGGTMYKGPCKLKKIKKLKKTLEVGGWVKCPIGNLKNVKIYFYTLFYYVFGRAFESQ